MVKIDQTEKNKNLTIRIVVLLIVQCFYDILLLKYVQYVGWGFLMDRKMIYDTFYHVNA